MTLTEKKNLLQRVVKKQASRHSRTFKQYNLRLHLKKIWTKWSLTIRTACRNACKPQKKQQQVLIFISKSTQKPGCIGYLWTENGSSILKTVHILKSIHTSPSLHLTMATHFKQYSWHRSSTSECFSPQSHPHHACALVTYVARD